MIGYNPTVGVVCWDTTNHCNRGLGTDSLYKYLTELLASGSRPVRSRIDRTPMSLCKMNDTKILNRGALVAHIQIIIRNTIHN